MKTLFFPTDFSETVTHAIEYGYSIAGQIKCKWLNLPGYDWTRE